MVDFMQQQEQQQGGDHQLKHRSSSQQQINPPSSEVESVLLGCGSIVFVIDSQDDYLESLVRGLNYAPL